MQEAAGEKWTVPACCAWAAMCDRTAHLKGGRVQSTTRWVQPSAMACLKGTPSNTAPSTSRRPLKAKSYALADDAQGHALEHRVAHAPSVPTSRGSNDDIRLSSQNSRQR